MVRIITNNSKRSLGAKPCSLHQGEEQPAIYTDPNVPPDPENYETQALYDQAFEQWTVALEQANQEERRKENLLLQFKVGQRVVVKDNQLHIEGEIEQILLPRLSAAVRQTTSPLALRDSDRVASMRRNAAKVGLAASSPDLSRWAIDTAEDFF